MRGGAIVVWLLYELEHTSRRGPRPPAHSNPLRRSLDMCSSPLPLLHTNIAVVFLYLCVLSGKLLYRHSVDWDPVTMHGLRPRPDCEVPITVPPLGTAGGYTWIELRWRCVRHYLFSCKASQRRCPDSTDLWADLQDVLLPEALAHKRVRLEFQVDSLNANSVRAHGIPWLLYPFPFLQGCPRVLLCGLLLPPLLSWLGLGVSLGASVADDAVPVGSRVFAAGLMHRSLSPLVLPPASRVAGRCPSFTVFWC
jgi:hypothetical protein